MKSYLYYSCWNHSGDNLRHCVLDKRQKRQPTLKNVPRRGKRSEGKRLQAWIIIIVVDPYSAQPEGGCGYNEVQRLAPAGLFTGPEMHGRTGEGITANGH
ncbi:MAG: hypothetical protein AB1552_03935 [Nitrospirota bacterium]